MTTNVAPNADDYLLDRSYAASARLNLQHFLWMGDVNHELLHRKIPVADEQLRVADVGTGTGIWLLDFARQHTQATQLDGLDISLDQVPHTAWLPSNVSFYRYDVYEEPPKDLVRKYDIIHVRHLTLVVKQNDPTAVLDNLLIMLKPGGYLQWGEFDLHNRVAITVQPDCSTVEMKGLQHRMRDFLHTPVASWPEELGKIFERAGLQDISFEGKWTEYSHLSFHMDVSLLVYEELIDMIAGQQRATPEEIKELRTRLAKAVVESRQGAVWNIKKLVAVGRKPA